MYPASGCPWSSWHSWQHYDQYQIGKCSNTGQIGEHCLLMKQLDIVVSPPAFHFKHVLTFTFEIRPWPLSLEPRDLWPWTMWPLTLTMRTFGRVPTTFSVSKPMQSPLKTHFSISWPWLLTLTFKVYPYIIKIHPHTKFHDPKCDPSW